MILHYFKNKENKDKKIANLIYLETINSSKLIINNNFLVKKKEFDLTFEIVSILLISIFIGSKNKLNTDWDLIRKELLYIFIKDFREAKFEDNIEIEGQEILDKIKQNDEQVIFVSGHFNNFELMAMHIEKSGINLAAIYRPLNNKFLNFVMEKIRKKYICKKQIKKGLSGTKQLLSFFREKTSIALMIDQRVSEGIKSNFFKHEALTTTIPAQFIKKCKCRVVPVYIERIKDINFKITIHKPLEYPVDETVESITLDLNFLLEKLILKNPEQWIWSHNRWK